MLYSLYKPQVGQVNQIFISNQQEDTMSFQTFSDQDHLDDLVPQSIHQEMRQMKRRFLTISITLGALVCALAILAFLVFATPTSAIAPANTLAGAPNLIT